MTDERTPEAQRLLELTVDHLLAHGISGVSLSSLAKGIGSNNRMLLYYFGSKDELYTAAIRAAYERFPRLRDLVVLLRADGTVAQVLSDAWRAVRAEENLPYTRLFFESFGVAAHAPDRNPSQLAAPGAEWPDALTAMFVAHGRDDAASVRFTVQTLALWRGLQFSMLEGVPAATLDDAHDTAIAALFGRDAHEVA